MNTKRRAILATKTGWMISVDITRETPKAIYYKEAFQGKEKRVSKADRGYKFFERGQYKDTDCIEKWMDEE